MTCELVQLLEPSLGFHDVELGKRNKISDCPYEKSMLEYKGRIIKWLLEVPTHHLTPGDFCTAFFFLLRKRCR